MISCILIEMSVVDSQKTISWRTVAGDIAEARDQLEKLEDAIKKQALSAGELQVGLQHAYFHLNFAWNARHASGTRYADMSDADFKKWGEYPRVMNQSE
jgi:hypothetical protein